LLLDKEDLVQKGYGWLLKVSSEENEKKVFDYVMKNKGKIPRTALRYAIEKMPKNLKKKAMVR
jgi:3-methyladenine DNA glycosylase AlkD